MELKQQQSASSSSVYSRLSLPKERIRLRNQFSISIPRVFPLTVSLCSLDFLFRRTNTMIEIITTRFHEAYTWILPPEQHVSHGSFTKEQQRMFSKYKQMNGNSHKTPLLDGDKSIHVIKIWFLSPLCHFPFVYSPRFIFMVGRAWSKHTTAEWQTSKVGSNQFSQLTELSFCFPQFSPIDLQWESEIVGRKEHRRSIISASIAWSYLSGLYKNDGRGEFGPIIKI